MINGKDVKIPIETALDKIFVTMPGGVKNDRIR